MVIKCGLVFLCLKPLNDQFGHCPYPGYKVQVSCGNIIISFTSSAAVSQTTTSQDYNPLQPPQTSNRNFQIDFHYAWLVLVGAHRTNLQSLNISSSPW